MNKQIVINGVGGQGIIYLTGVLTKVAVKQGLNVRVSQTYGMAQRGGSVISFIKIGNFLSPMIIPMDADILICLHKDELATGKYYLKDNGKIFINSDEYFNATSLALKLKNPSMTNIIFLGYICKEKDFPFSFNQIFELLTDDAKKYFKYGYEA